MQQSRNWNLAVAYAGKGHLRWRVVTNPSVEAHDRAAEPRTQIWISAISALSGVLVAVIGVFGTIAVTNREIVPRASPERPSSER